MNRQKGFTMFEMLLVLTIITTVFGIVLPLVNEALEEVSVGLFLKDFQMHLRMIQNQALLTGENTKMTLSFSEKKIIFEGNYQKKIKETLYIPDSITGEGTIIFQFKGGTGGYGKFQRIIFISKKNEHHFIFQIGSGRYRYEKKQLAQ